jgi:hypothetical protein
MVVAVSQHGRRTAAQSRRCAAGTGLVKSLRANGSFSFEFQSAPNVQMAATQQDGVNLAPKLPVATHHPEGEREGRTA